MNASQKHSSSRGQRSGYKRNPNFGPPMSMQLPYGQPPIAPVMHPMVPPPQMIVHGYPYQPIPGPFPSPESHIVKSGCETPVQAFIRPPPVMDSSVPPPPQKDPKASPNSPSGRPSLPEPGGPANHTWSHQRTMGPRENIPMQQGIRPRAFVRPPFLVPAPGLIVGPGYPGSVSFFFFFFLFFCLIFSIHLI